MGTEINKGKITLKEHYELGKYLRIASDKLIRECNKIKPKIIVRKSKEAKTLKLLGELRSPLEDIMFKDYGEEGDKKFKQNWWQDIYYETAGRRGND